MLETEEDTMINCKDLKEYHYNWVETTFEKVKSGRMYMIVNKYIDNGPKFAYSNDTVNIIRAETDAYMTPNGKWCFKTYMEIGEM